VDNVTLVQVLDSAARLDHESSDLGHGEVFSLLDRVGERPIFAEFKDNVCAGFEGEGAVELDDVGMR
jgi:hypothetical protein